MHKRSRSESACVDYSLERARILGVKVFDAQKGRRKYASSADFLKATKSWIAERRPVCPRCGRRFPSPDEVRELFAERYGHRNPAGFPCPSWTVAERINYRRDGVKQEATMTEAKSADTRVAPSADVPARRGRPKPKVLKRADQRARRERFVREYQVDHDLVAAAKRAGLYGPYGLKVARKLLATSTKNDVAVRESTINDVAPQPTPTVTDVLQVSSTGRVTLGDLAALPPSVQISVDSNGVRVRVLGAA